MLKEIKFKILSGGGRTKHNCSQPSKSNKEGGRIL